jgi:2,3-bisphosphoglycerate-independent phosphoglycerate mutase
MSWGKKILLITLDGIADRPAPTLGGKTPLEIAKTPHLDALAKRGINGRLHSLSLGVPLSTDVAHYLLFGYPIEERPGRSVFEAMGYGVTFSDDEVICATSFALVTPEENTLKIINRRELGLAAPEGQQLVKAVSHYQYQGFEFNVVYTKKHFGVLKITGDVSDRITDSDPFYTNLPVIAVQPLDNTPSAAKTATALNEYLRWTYTVLNKMSQKVNILLTKWPARHRPVMPFAEKFGMRGVSISSKEIMNGLATYLGLDVVNAERLCPPEGRILEASLRCAFDKFEKEDYDFVHIHDLRPDVISHKKDPAAKTALIEEIDDEMRLLVLGLKEDWVVAITCDHVTPSTVGVGKAMHAGEPVPLTMVATHALVDDVATFSERSVIHGGLGQIYGRDLMNILMNYADRLGNYGFRPRPVHEDTASYRPKTVKPLPPP